MESSRQSEVLARKISARELNELRSILRGALYPYEKEMQRFYDEVETLDMSTGAHPWAREATGGAGGYMVIGKKASEWTSVGCFPFINPCKIDIGVPYRERTAVIELLLQDPMQVGSLWACFLRRKIAFLTGELYEAQETGAVMTRQVMLSRGEAAALLHGEVLGSTRRKVSRAFEMRIEDD